MSSIIDTLRASMAGNEYPRPDLSEDDKQSLQKIAKKLAAIRDDRLRLTYYMAICVENARLLKEVNEHRQARGFNPLTVHKNEDE